MIYKINKLNFLSAAFLILLLVFASSCGQNELYEGTYLAQGGEPSKYSGSQLQLMEKGQAVWRVTDNEISFRWDIKDGDLWLSNKSGGIIIGKIINDTIEITLPGAKKMCFKRE